MEWDSSVEVLVVGSGLGAMTTALCSHEMGAKNVLVIEKANVYGGLSCRSGGGLWIPTNRYAQAAGAEDSLDDALTYLKQTLPEDTDFEKAKAYLAAAPQMLNMAHERFGARYHSMATYPDYYTSLPGARLGHRMIEPDPFLIDQLGEEWQHLGLQHPQFLMMDRAYVTQREGQEFMNQLPGWAGLAGKIMWNYFSDYPWRFKTKRDRRATCGAAAVAYLRLAMLKRDIPLWRNTRMIDLVQENGKVIGVIAEREGKRIAIRASRGVVLATGGFEKNQAMREKYLPKPTNIKWSPGIDTNEGDSINIGLKYGAALGRMDGAWWCPNYCIPGEPIPFLAITERGSPGNVIVNINGKRITNESKCYMRYIQSLYAAHSEKNPSSPTYMIFDATFRKNYLVGPLLNSTFKPDFMLPRKFFDEGFLAKANTIAELAQKTGINAKTLDETVAKMNEYARTGKDLEFGRGDEAYDLYYSDPRVKPNPCLAPIAKPPFYAIRMELGDFGTHGGLVTDSSARVCKESGEVIPGLYATGNTSAALLSTYPGAGATLGPSTTFGYLAAKHMTNA